MLSVCLVNGEALRSVLSRFVVTLTLTHILPLQTESAGRLTTQRLTHTISMPILHMCVCICACTAYYVCTSIDHSVTKIICTVFHMVELLMW